jgi:hypothetical protein
MSDDEREIREIHENDPAVKRMFEIKPLALGGIDPEAECQRLQAENELLKEGFAAAELVDERIQQIVNERADAGIDPLEDPVLLKAKSVILYYFRKAEGLQVENERLRGELKAERENNCTMCADIVEEDIIAENNNLQTQLAAAQAEGAVMREVLKGLEWFEVDRGIDFIHTLYYCPVCEQEQGDGHATDCALNQALSAPAAEYAEKVRRMEEAAESLVKNMTESIIEEMRDFWGNTNVNLYIEKRNKLAEALDALEGRSG